MKSGIVLNRLLLVGLLVPLLNAGHIAGEPLRIDISSLVPQGAGSYNGTLAFLTDTIIAVGVCSHATCNIETFDLANDVPRQIGRLNGTERYHALLRHANSKLLLGGVSKNGQKGAVLLDENLVSSQWIPQTSHASAPAQDREANSRLFAHTDDLTAYWDQQFILIRQLNGKPLGSFQVRSSTRGSAPTVVFLGRDRILFKDAKDWNWEVRSFNGKHIRTLKDARGSMGHITKTTENGSKLLFDSFTRRVGPVQGVIDKALAVVTAGMSTDGDVPNEEVVQVVDTSTGRRCFEWHGKDNLLPEFVDHADISPSGERVAIITLGIATIFKVPEARCR